MVSIKVKLRHSSVAGRSGSIYYQITHRRETRRIVSDIRLLPVQWNPDRQRVVEGRGVDAGRLQRVIDCDTRLLRRIVSERAAILSPTTSWNGFPIPSAESIFCTSCATAYVS